MRNRTKRIAALVLAIATIFLMAIPSFAIKGINNFKENDCWKIGRTASYVNPDTGLTADGGDNSPIGMAMSNNLVDKRMMLEQVNGKYYITFSMVGMSFSKNLRVYIYDANGKSRLAKHVVTYSSAAESLGTQHFRVEVKPTDKYISPRLFVIAMGRDVQFFITPELGNAKKGCGPFVSEFYPNRYERETQKDMSGFIDLIPTKPGGEKPGEPDQQVELTTTPREPVKPAKPSTPKPAVTTEIASDESLTETETETETETILEEIITDEEVITDEIKSDETTAEAKDEGMSTGAKVGIAIGVIALLAIIGGVVYVIITKKKA